MSHFLKKKGLPGTSLKQGIPSTQMKPALGSTIQPISRTCGDFGPFAGRFMPYLFLGNQLCDLGYTKRVYGNYEPAWTAAACNSGLPSINYGA